MSEAITHTAAVDDIMRLIRISPDICKPFKEVMEKHPDTARLAGVTRHGDFHNPGLLDKFRKGWNERKPEDKWDQKLAFVLGWMTHRAADRCMKRVFRALDADCSESPTDCSVYNDVEVFRQVYLNAADGDGSAPFTRYSVSAGMKDHPAAGDKAIDSVEDLFFGMWQRLLISMHTFIPDDSNVEIWLDNVISKYQVLRVDLRRYAKALTDPDPEKYLKFIKEPNFYNPDDPIITLVRSLQKGEKPDIELDEAPAGESQYAGILQRAFGYVTAASEFFEFRIEMDELRERMDIGKPEY